MNLVVVSIKQQCSTRLVVMMSVEINSLLHLLPLCYLPVELLS